MREKNTRSSLGAVVGVGIALGIVGSAKYLDVARVRRDVPDLGVIESATWPLYEVRHLPPDEVRAWVDAMRRGDRDLAMTIAGW